MPRVKRGIMTHKRHHRILKDASGYWGGKSRLFKTAKEAVMKSGNYAYRDRRNRKRDFRRIWIARINAACRLNGMQYSKFISAMTKLNVQIDRKMFSEIAIADPETFTALVNRAKEIYS
ncbi:MAG: 50S ribosomal protein L20 [Abditibacteriota bacterium]|nr:50S ribosomal protein L20 [Abditibacteriota bacterium]